MTFLKHSWLRYYPALLSGLLLTAAFPDPGLSWAAFLALVPLWTALTRMTPREGFRAGLITGLVHFLTLIYWLVPTLTIYGGLNPYLALSTLVLLALYLALYPALFAWLLVRIPAPAATAPLWGALVWVGLEYLRTHALTGFPWGVLGYSQSANLTLLQVADLVGVLGISFVLVVCNGALAGLWAWFCQGRKGWAQPLFSLAWGLGFLALALGYGAFRLPQIQRAETAAPQVAIAVAQGNVAQDKKWSPEFKAETVERYARLSLAAAPADLIVWPETALPFYYGRDPVFSGRVDEIVKKAGTPFLMGSPAAEVDKEDFRYYNRAYLLNPKALVTGHYDKTHLVPFGEYVPLQDLLFFIEKITAEAGNFSPGQAGQKPLAFGNHSTGVLICFEILFPGIARDFVRNGADLLTTLTNDAWFGRTSAPAQHFAVAVLRAVENRRALVRAANTGISGLISPTGQVLATTPLFETQTLSGRVPAMTLTPFYTRHGDLLGLAALVAICAVFMVKRMRSFTGKGGPKR